MSSGENSVSPKTPFLGPEYREYSEELYEGSSLQGSCSDWDVIPREHTRRQSSMTFSEMSTSLAVKNVILQMLLPALKAQGQHFNENQLCEAVEAEQNDLVGMMRDMIAREISRHTMGAVDSHQQQAASKMQFHSNR
ncbi:hypothetical protein GOP47_0006160 [Adiantum capillus-veneris]|nr:hypothetical protein GOP47_0006160 [Adiantum capillus-veneris]